MSKVPQRSPPRKNIMILERFSLAGKTAVITGAGRGIGFAIAHAFAEAGAKIIIADRDAVLGMQAAVTLGAAAEFAALDVSDSASVRAVSADLHRRHHRIDILVNNAAICEIVDALATTDDIWRRHMAVNLDGLFYCCREFGRQMVAAQQGAIVNIVSIGALIEPRLQHHIAYGASKAGVAQMTRSLAVEWASSGVRVNAVAPGYTATELALTAGHELIQSWLPHIPLGRLMEPAEIAAAVLFFASAASSGLTGAMLAVDGGYTVL
jgi:NAD(P)-dependent dehydrogenase (short-subunit alcohol dehydrogenase family)